MRPARGMRRPLRNRFSALLLGWIAIVGCGPSDPLDPIRRQLARGAYQESLEPLRELLAERKDDAELQYLYGMTLSQLNQPSLAEWSLRGAMNDPDWLVAAGRQLAQGALLTHNYELAIETANRVLEVAPDDVGVLLMLANAHAHSRMAPDEALEDVERIFELDPDNLDAMEPRILALLGLERIDEAAAAIELLGEKIDAVGAESELAGWHCATAALFAFESDEALLAEERWADCVERFPGHTNVIDNAVRYYDGRQEYDRSLDILRRGQEENLNSRQLRVVLSERLRVMGFPDEAETLLRKATEVEHALLSTAAWVDLAKHYQELEDYAASVRACEAGYERIREAGQTPPPHLLLEYADALLIAGELDRALAIAEEMSVPAHLRMIQARVAQQAGRNAEALEFFEQAFQLWPDNVFARYHAALAAEAIGDFDRAVESYRYAIRIAPDATDANVRVARLHLAEGRVREALLLLRLNTRVALLGPEAALLSLHLAARLGRLELVRQGLSRFAKGLPDQLGAAVEQAARGLGESSGPAAAIRFIRQAESGGVDLTDPRNADALRVLVRFSQDAGRLDEAEPAVQAALAAHPDAAFPHEIQGLLLELGGGRDKARGAYGRALELDAGNEHALRGLGRLSEEHPEQALSYFDRALEQTPGDPEAILGASAALIRAGEPEQAEVRLEALLETHPYTSAAAAELVELMLERETATEDRTLELANRAVRFGGGAEALELKSRVHERRGEAEEASRAAERAGNLRERSRG